MTTGQLATVMVRLRRAALPPDGAGATDGALLAAVVSSKDEVAFACLVKRHGPMVFGVCRRVLGNIHDAEDAFQATFLVLIRKAATVVPAEKLGNWLYGVAYRTAMEAKRRMGRRRHKEMHAREMRPNTDSDPDWWELRRLLDEELSRLPGKHRVPIVLCDLEGRTRREVARQLRLPDGTLSNRLAKARKILGQRLARRGVVLSASALAMALAQQAAVAGLSARLVAATVQAAVLTAASKPVAAGLISAKVSALTEGVLKIMFLNKLKAMVLALLVLALASAGGVCLCQATSAQDTSTGPLAERTQVTQEKVSKESESRADKLKTIQAEYKTAYDDFLGAARAGKIKAAQDGAYPELAELRNRFAQRTRHLIDADAKDAVALDAILFSIQQLVADEKDRKLYDLLEAHHLASPKLGNIVGRSQQNQQFLRKLIAGSPDAGIRANATLVLAKRLARANQVREAEDLCAEVAKNTDLAKHFHDRAGDMLFEIQRLGVGKIIPEIEGVDMDNKPMKLSEYRGKATMVVFWATWCGPCMAMVPHERELAKRYADRPFAIVGINGDADSFIGDDGKPIDNTAKIQKIIKREQITWRSFKDMLPKEKRQISHRWNVVEWPTVFLIDHEGVIRRVFRGVDNKVLDAAIEKLVAGVEAAKKN